MRMSRLLPVQASVRCTGHVRKDAERNRTVRWSVQGCDVVPLSHALRRPIPADAAESQQRRSLMVDETNNVSRSNNTQSGYPQSGGGMQTLRNAKARLGIIGIVIVVILALVFHVNPMQALQLFGGNQTTTTTQTTQPVQPAPQQNTR